MDVYLNLQLGLPAETTKDRAQTINTLIRLGHAAATRDRTITVFPQLSVVYPGTPHFQEAIDKGVFGDLGREVFEESPPGKPEKSQYSLISGSILLTELGVFRLGC